MVKESRLTRNIKATGSLCELIEKRMYNGMTEGKVGPELNSGKNIEVETPRRLKVSLPGRTTT